MGPEATNAGDWATAMQKAQADLLRQWTEMGSAWAKATGSPGVPGAQPAATAGTAAPEADDVARRFLSQCEQYLGVSRSLWDLVGRASSSSDPEQRTRVFTDGLGGLQQQFANLWVATPFGAPGGGAGAIGTNPFAFGAGSIPGMSMPGMAMPGFSATIPGMPALGPTRESQEAMQRLAQLGARYAQAQLQVSGQWNDIIGKSLRELGERLAPKLRSGAAPASMKEVYDLWVDSAETVYAQAARGAAFVQAQAELTNSMSQLRSAQRELLEEWAKQFDLPTRAELNSIHKQLRDLKAALQR
jgi:class III poly(R)-hydroxyalkanoic acid synthase PhaE subunit